MDDSLLVRSGQKRFFICVSVLHGATSLLMKLAE